MTLPSRETQQLCPAANHGGIWRANSLLTRNCVLFTLHEQEGSASVPSKTMPHLRHYLPHLTQLDRINPPPHCQGKNTVPRFVGLGQWMREGMMTAPYLNTSLWDGLGLKSEKGVKTGPWRIWWDGRVEREKRELALTWDKFA